MTVDVSVKGVTARVATVSKETMSCGASKLAIRKEIISQKNKIRQHYLRL